MHQWEGSDPSVLLWIKMSCQLSLLCMSVSSTPQENSVGPFNDEKWENSHKCDREEKLKSTQQGEDESRKSSEAQLLLLFPESQAIQSISKWFALFKCFMHVNTHNSSNPSLIFGDKMFNSSHEIAGGKGVNDDIVVFLFMWNDSVVCWSVN